ncbi:MAG: endonuclease [Ignavibacterium sp.]|jgi:endonuclease I|nr:endonuclease [Ignavibacterium sp.]
MFKIFLITAVILSINIIAQVSVTTDSISFPQIFTGTEDSQSVYIKNLSDNQSEIKINYTKNVYSVSDSVLLIASNDSSLLWIKYNPDQNVIDNDLIFITSSDSTIGSVIKLSGSGKFGDSYDAATFNLYDTQLKSVLTQLISGHTSLGYNLARDKMFMEFDNQRVNGQGATQNTLECVYTGRLAIGYTSRTDAQGPNYNFNTEHTWPQSNFNEQEPMKSDLYHLFPTDVTANSIRANYPFGKVVSNVTWQVGGSKLGNSSSGQIVFEPRDVHKGDVSRSMFYFITRYPVNYGNFFTQTQENIFREWNKLDTVGVIESNRNNAIALLQLKRNPYIDHPEFVDRIYSFTSNNVRPTFAELNVLPLKIEFDSTSINTSSSNQVYIANSGNEQLDIDSITISEARFIINSSPTSIESFSFSKILIEFTPDSIKNYDATLTVFSNGGIKNILLTGIGNDNTVNIKDEISLPIAFTLEQNYPNPFNPSTTISWQSPVGSWQTLKIFDALGREVETLLNEYRPAGLHSTVYIVNPAIPSGVYFYQLRSGNYVAAKKMTLLK